MIGTVIGTLLVGISGCASQGWVGFAGSTAGSIFANMATDWMKSLCRFTDERYLQRYGKIDENHVIVRGLREAQLKALRKVLDRFNTDRRGHRDPAQDDFAAFLAEFLTREEEFARTLRFEGTQDAPEAEKKLRRDIVGMLPDAAQAGLAARRGGEDAKKARDRFRLGCEEAVLRELRELAFADIPPFFVAAFRGNPGRADGWFDLFFRDVAARIEAGGDFDRIWQQEQTAAIEYAVDATREQVAEIKSVVSAIRDELVAVGAALAALADEVGAVREYAELFHHRTLGDGVMPLDFESVVDIQGLRRFKPRNPLVPFIGREAEAAALRRFLDAPPDFAWWLLCGSGGAGKTRLALRLAMMAHAVGWRAGFLPDGFSPDIADLASWQPQRPTVIIVDYTLKYLAAANRLAERLSHRASTLPNPVRLLLIEREGGIGFDAQFLAADSKGVIPPHRYHDPEYGPELAVPALSEDELWTLVEGGRWHPEPRRLPPARETFLRRLDELDVQRRPLVGMILADAITAQPERPAFDNLESELEDLLKRERRDLWPADLGCAGREIGQADADAAIAFATMVGGLDSEVFGALEAACGRTSQVDYPACARAVGARFDPNAPHVPKLEPDLIGEFFALKVLDRKEGFRGLQWPHLGEAAWRARPDRMADFVRRAAQNFLHNPAVERLQKPIRGILESWLLRGFTLLTDADTLDAGLVRATDALRDAAMQDAAAATALGEIAISITALPDDATEAPLRFSLLRTLASARDAHKDEPTLREQWANAVTNYIADRAAAEPQPCRGQLDAVRALADAHRDEPVLREIWATAVFNYVHRCAAAEPQPCRGLLDAMRALADEHRDEPVLREQWAQAVFNYVSDCAAAEPQPCRGLLDAVRALADEHRDEPVLREHWAEAVTNYVGRCAAAEPQPCRGLLDAVRALADEHRDEPVLREQWAAAVTNYIADRAAAEPQPCRGLLDAVRALADEHRDEPVLREQWAKAVTNYVHRCAAAEPQPCRGLLDAVRALAEAVGRRLFDLASGRDALLAKVLVRFGIRLPKE